jgi:hypothetical protein
VITGPVQGNGGMVSSHETVVRAFTRACVGKSTGIPEVAPFIGPRRVIVYPDYSYEGNGTPVAVSMLDYISEGA